MQGTRSSWLWFWHFRNGGTGWSARLNRSWCGRTTTTLPTSGTPRGSTPGRPGGICSCDVFSSRSHTSLAHATRSQTPCPASSRLILWRQMSSVSPGFPETSCLTVVHSYVSGVEGLLGVLASLTSGYHPQAKGQAERTNHCLEDALRCVAQNLSAWNTYLLWVEHTHNSLVSAFTGLSPLQGFPGVPVSVT